MTELVIVSSFSKIIPAEPVISTLVVAVIDVKAPVVALFAPTVPSRLATNEPVVIVRFPVLAPVAVVVPTLNLS